jgi:hypothetical protein
MGRDVGLLPAELAASVERKRACIAEELQRLQKTLSEGATLETHLRRPEVSYAQLPQLVPTWIPRWSNKSRSKSNMQVHLKAVLGRKIA